MEVTIRSATEADIPRIAEINLECFSGNRWGGIDLARKWIEDKFASHPSIQYFVAEMTGGDFVSDNRFGRDFVAEAPEPKIVGFIKWDDLGGFRKEAVVELEQIAVTKPLRNNGVGEKLIRGSFSEVMGYLQNAGRKLKLVKVTTGAEHLLMSQGLYRKTLGAKPHCVIENYYRDDELVMLARMDNPLIIFDQCGTLIDSASANVKAFQYGFEAMNLDIPMAEDIKGLLGTPPYDMAVKLGCPLESVDEMYKQYILPNYLENMARNINSFDGVYKTLQKLDERFNFAVCTSGPKGLQETILSSTGLLGFFDKVHSAVNSKYKRPDPRFLQECIQSYCRPFKKIYYVGDTADDIRMGEAASVETVFAEYGYGKIEDVKPDHTIKSPAGLVDLVA